MFFSLAHIFHGKVVSETAATRTDAAAMNGNNRTMGRNRLWRRSLYPVQADAETDVCRTRPCPPGDGVEIQGGEGGSSGSGAEGRIRRSGSCYAAATAGSGCCCSLWGWEPACLLLTACPNTGCCSRAARWAAKEKENKWGEKSCQINWTEI